MRQVDYQRLEHDVETVTATLVEFLEDIPFLAAYEYFPPLLALNDLLGRGFHGDSQHLLKWEPFAVSADEYSAVAEAFKAKKGWKPSPSGIDSGSYDQWKAILTESHTGLPAGKYLSAVRRMSELARRRDEARAIGNDRLSDELQEEWMRVSAELANLVNKHLL